MRFKQRLLTATVALLSMPAWAAAESLTIFDIPGAFSTFATGINNRGEIVGTFTESQFGNTRGYVFRRDAVTILEIPGQTSVVPMCINDRGQIVGFSAPGPRGFLWDDGVVTSITVPGASQTVLHGINNDGQILGHSRQDLFALARAFLWADGQFTFLDVPGVLPVVASATEASMGFNDRGQIVGPVQSGGRQHGFLLDNGELTLIDVPDATHTLASGINNRGQIVGVYHVVGDQGIYLRHPDGSFTLIDIPGASSIHRVTISDRGAIAGSFTDTAGTIHGFLWTR